MSAMYYETLAAVLFVSGISFIGVVALAMTQRRLQNILVILVSFAAGALFGDAFIHLLPEAFETSENFLATSLYSLSGIVLFFIVEKFVRWHHHHAPHLDKQHLATINLIGDGVHNFIDGMLIAASFLVSFPLGFATTVAVVLHEIPTEIGDFGVLIHAGLKRRKVLLYNFASALTAVAGAIIVLLIGESSQKIVQILIPMTAGVFLYIAGSDLVPELHGEIKIPDSIKQLVALVAGIAVMALLLFFE